MEGVRGSVGGGGGRPCWGVGESGLFEEVSGGSHEGAASLTPPTPLTPLFGPIGARSLKGAGGRRARGTFISTSRDYNRGFISTRYSPRLTLYF